MRVLRSLPGWCGHAMFSHVGPNTHIVPHAGPGNYKIRLHLGLVVPPPPTRTALRAGAGLRTWREGRVTVFDDSLEHEVFNHAPARSRVVLMADVWHPSLSAAEVAATRARLGAASDGARLGALLARTKLARDDPFWEEFAQMS